MNILLVGDKAKTLDEVKKLGYEIAEPDADGKAKGIKAFGFNDRLIVQKAALVTAYLFRNTLIFLNKETFILVLPLLLQKNNL